ncbi:fimbria/pilus outer membrane usher protein [Providencia sp.]
MANYRYYVLYSIIFYSLSGFSEPKNTEIIFNNEYKGSIALEINNDIPCLSSSLLEEWGVKDNVLADLKWTGEDCLISQYAQTKNIQYWYNNKASLLTVLLPSEYIENQNNRVSTSRWNDGVNALFTSYQFELTHLQGESYWEPIGTSSSLELNSGINLGAWRIRNKSNVWFKENHLGSYSQENALWRSINKIRSRLNIGDNRTLSSIFTPFNYQGIGLSSDKAMFPDNWNTFPALINGYARTDAEVSVSQNGNQIYRIHVKAGSFTINDLFPPSSDGDLEITIKESDGKEITRVIPYSAIPNILQKDKFNYEATIGHYRPSRESKLSKDKFAQLGVIWGMFSRVSLYSGLQQAINYRNITTGTGIRLNEFGAISLDFSHASYKIAEKDISGNMVRAQYNKITYSTNTNFNASLQYYPQKSYWRSFEEKLTNDFIYRSYNYDSGYPDRRWKLNFYINQIFNEDSNLTLTWAINKQQKQSKLLHDATVAYNYSSDDFDASVYSEYSRYSPASPADIKIGINVSIPFSLAGKSINLNPISEISNNENNRNGINLNGSLLNESSDTRYDLTATHVSQQGNEFNASFNHSYNQGSTNIRYENNITNTLYHMEMDGSILLYDEGLVLGQSLGNTVAIADVPNTEGIGFYNQFNVKTDNNGKMIITNLTPWRVNTITLDSYNVPNDLSFDNTENTIVPTDGAVVKLIFTPTHVAPLQK